MILERVAGLSPGMAPVANHLTETLAIVKRYEDADRWGREAMEFGPDEPMNFTIAAWSAVQAGWPDRARRYVAEIPPPRIPRSGSGSSGSVSRSGICRPRGAMPNCCPSARSRSTRSFRKTSAWRWSAA
ncbi:MAG: hypothetical protein IPI34_03170 [bacterium]|nr:hypothetical protein [bacterium]